MARGKNSRLERQGGQVRGIHAQKTGGTLTQTKGQRLPAKREKGTNNRRGGKLTAGWDYFNMA